MTMRISRPGVREGYDQWSESYDDTPNPLVALDRRHTLEHLRPRGGERVLDAGCGTGVHMRAIHAYGGKAVGVDFSWGMLRVARRAIPGALLAQADLNHDLPFRRGIFDALLCALVSEHLTNLRKLFEQAFTVLRKSGRLVFSAFHPELVAAGIESNFEQDGTEYRLGAERHTVDDYLNHIDAAGFRSLRWSEYCIDSELARRIPRAEKYIGRPLLLIIDAIHPQSRIA